MNLETRSLSLVVITAIYSSPVFGQDEPTAAVAYYSVTARIVETVRETHSKISG